MVKNLPASAGDRGSIPGSGRSPGEGNDNLLQYYYLEKSHGQRGLAGCSPWGHEELYMTEHIYTHTPTLRSLGMLSTLHSFNRCLLIHIGYTDIAPFTRFVFK